MTFAQTLQHFLAQADTVGQALFALLLSMSVTSWYFIFAKAWQGIRIRRNMQRFFIRFDAAAATDHPAAIADRDGCDGPFRRLAEHAAKAAAHYAKRTAGHPESSGQAADFIGRAMRRIIDEESAKLEWGLTALASVASTSPFVGLFGTVWGVYHALASIGRSGQASLEQIADPVGEALIMTGLGLAVAIPAVLAYNDCLRTNRVLLARLEAFAHDLLTVLTTGSAIDTPAAPPPIRPAEAY